MKLQIARIGKPHGIRGEVTVQLFTDVPEDRFGAGAVLMAEPASKGPLTVSSARWNKQILVLGFEEVTTRNGAEELRGTQLFIDADEPENDDEGWYSHDLEGLKAMVDGRQVGTVSELVTGTAQDLLVIAVPGGPDVLVPFVEAIVPDVDVEGGFITLTPPPGLLELGTEGEA